MKAYTKTIHRTIKSNISRFIALISIILVGVCFVTGIGGISTKIINSVDENLIKYQAADIILKSESQTGFVQDDLDIIKKQDNVKDATMITSLDMNFEDKMVRMYLYNFEDEINKLELISGKMPSSSEECVIERKNKEPLNYNIGDEINIYGMNFKITGVVANPLIYSRDGEPSIISDDLLSLIVYFDKSVSNLSAFLPNTDIYIKLNNVKSYFSNGYLDYVNSNIEQLKKLDGFDEDKVSYITMNENKSYLLITNITDKIDVIAMIFPVFFILVVALVTLTTMSRMIDEERSIIGCFKSLGYTNGSIIGKYMFFAIISMLIGSIIGLVTGAYFLPNIIFPAFDSIIFSPDMTSNVSFASGIWSSILMLVSIILVTLYVCFKNLRETPSQLLLPKAPKPGKKVFLEHIGFIWKRLKFKHKSSFRNIFRYGGRLAMVIISVSGATALVLAGFGLNDISNSKIVLNGMEIDVSSTLKLVSFAIILFALALCILVLFNLTNMSIGERKREIATLKVLGYIDLEVYGYIFREILVMSIFGIILGLPLGFGLIAFIINYLDFGSINSIKWYSYISTIILVICFVGVVDLMLCHKIKKIDMNDSLKSIE